MAIDGRSVDPRRTVEEQIEGNSRKADQKVSTLAASPDGAGTRGVTVVPLPGENAVRRTLRAEECRRHVDAPLGRPASRRLAAPLGGSSTSTGSGGVSGTRGARTGRGSSYDSADNSRSITADTVVDAFLARPVYAYAYRWGDDFGIPHNLVHGPKVVLVNERDFSAGETFPLMAKITKAATLVGTTTGGGGIGAALFAPRLVDGGVVRIPNRAAYNPVLGLWDIENKGVEPDVPVENTVADWRAGRDRQLETAVAVALKALETWKEPPARRPAPPVHPR